MKVILAAKSVYPFHPFGGVQKYIYYFAKNLVRCGINVEIVAPQDARAARVEEYEGLSYRLLRPAIYQYLEYPVGWWGVHLFSRSLARYLKKTRFDLLHSFDLTGYQYLKIKSRKPVIAHIFTDNYLSNPISLTNISNIWNFTAARFDKIKEKKVKISPFDDLSVKAQYLGQYMFKVRPLHESLRRCDAAFFEDEIFRGDVAKLYRINLQKCSVVPVGIDIPCVEQALTRTSISRPGLGLGKEDIVLISVNRLAADKGVDKIITALERIVKDIPKLRLIMIGGGYQERELLEMIRQKDLTRYVRHLKNVPEEDLYQYYRLSDIYVCAFSYPGSSISTLEAMACSLPIITTAQPWLVEEGRNGLFLKDNEPGTIGDAVIRLIRENKLKSQGVLSRTMVQKFSWDNIAREAVRRYQDILKLDN